MNDVKLLIIAILDIFYKLKNASVIAFFFLIEECYILTPIVTFIHACVTICFRNILHCKWIN